MRTLLCFALAGLLAGPAAAATPVAAPAPRAAPPAADAAATRAEIDRLVDRIHELSGKLGPDEHVRVIRLDSGPDGHLMRLPPEERARSERDFPRDHPRAMRELPREIRIERLGGGPAVGIGVVLSPNPAAPGVRLAAVTPDGPAAKAGLRSGDVLLSVDGKRVLGNGEQALASAHDLLAGLDKGRKLKLGYVRAGKSGEATVVAGDIRRAMLLGGTPGAATWNLGDTEMRELRMLAPEIDGELRRMLPMAAPCAPGDDDCAMPALFEAFRWQGLNLAAIDTDLGRYFGTNAGVLVLGGGLKGLRSGDVIQRVGGTAVDSPRDVMRALRTRAVGATLPILVLREHKPVTVTVTVPEARPLPFLPPTPPTPPVAPVPPTPPTPPAHRPAHAPAAMPALPAPPAPPAAPTPPEDDDSAQIDPSPDSLVVTMI